MAIKGLGKRTLQKLVDHFAQTPIQSEPGISSASQVTPSSTHASEISSPLESEQKPITPSGESESKPLKTLSSLPKTSLKTSTKEEQLLATINNLDKNELICQLISAKLEGSVINAIVEQRPFASTEVIIKLKGVGKRKWEVIANLLKNK
jgi:DNA uptake protein ComE-like DNA-binding protein